MGKLITFWLPTTQINIDIEIGSKKFGNEHYMVKTLKDWLKKHKKYHIKYDIPKKKCSILKYTGCTALQYTICRTWLVHKLTERT